MNIRFNIIGYRDTAYSTNSDDGLGYYNKQQKLVLKNVDKTTIDKMFHDGYEYQPNHIIDCMMETNSITTTYNGENDTLIVENCMRVFNSYDECDASEVDIY